MNEYFMIYDWMVNKLDLKGNDLLVYALIYNNDTIINQTINNTIEFFANWCNSSKTGVIKNINSLKQKGYIEEYITNTTKFYTINNKVLDNLNISNKVVIVDKQSLLAPNNTELDYLYSKFSETERKLEEYKGEIVYE